MKKMLALLGALSLAVLLFSGCARQNGEAQTVHVAALAGPTGIGMAQMIVEGGDFGENGTVNFSVATSADQVIASVINGDVQIAAVPTNTAAILYHKTKGDVVLGAVNTLGTLSLVADNGEQIRDIRDLKGKTIVATGQGATPEIVLKVLLEQNGLKIGEDVQVQWTAEHTEAAAKLIQGEAAIAMLPEPFATATLTKNETLSKAIDLTQAWESTTGSQLTMGCIVVNGQWAKDNPDVLKQFMSSYQKSIETMIKADDRAGKLVVQAGIMENEVLAKKAIPHCALTFMTPEAARADLSAYYQFLADFDPKTVGGKVPDEAFYALTY